MDKKDKRKGDIRFVFLTLLPVVMLIWNGILCCLFYSFQQGGSFFENFDWRMFYEMKYFIRKGIVPNETQGIFFVLSFGALFLLMGALKKRIEGSQLHDRNDKNDA